MSFNMVHKVDINSPSQALLSGNTLIITGYDGRQHTVKEKIQLVEDFLKWIKTKSDYHFVTVEQIYNKYGQ